MTNIKHIAQLANIPISDDEEKKLASAFDDTLKVVEQLKNIDVKNVTPTFQVTGLENVWREDVIDETAMFSQTQALANAKHTHDGYIVVPQIIDQD